MDRQPDGQLLPGHRLRAAEKAAPRASGRPPAPSPGLPCVSLEPKEAPPGQQGHLLPPVPLIRYPTHSVIHSVTHALYS